MTIGEDRHHRMMTITEDHHHQIIAEGLLLQDTEDVVVALFAAGETIVEEVADHDLLLKISLHFDPMKKKWLG